MKKIILLILGLTTYSLVWGQNISLEDLQKTMTENNIQTLEGFIEILPVELKNNYTLMHDSKSLHSSDFMRPRAILFNKKADLIVTFNGDETQAAGKKIELMTYSSEKRKYEFHEIIFYHNAPPLVKANPAICLSCHGAEPRPIWDHYNEWPGAYGSFDDKMTVEELSYLKKFMEAAPEHPRFSQLQNLKGGYRILNETIGTDGHTRERSMKNRNRDLTIALFQQRAEAVTVEMGQHPQFSTYKELVMFFLAKCYRDPKISYQGDGGSITDAEVLIHFKKIAAKNKGYSPTPFAPDQALDFIFARLGVDTHAWYLSSRLLPTYKSFRDGTDRVHEGWAAKFLNQVPEWKDSFTITPLDYQIDFVNLAIPKANFCEDIAPLAFQQAEKILTLKNPEDTTTVIINPNKVQLPLMCLKCHTQADEAGKIHLPFQDLKQQVRKGDTVLTKKMLQYITINASGRAKMPMRTTGDEAQYRAYLKNDYPQLKKYLEDLLR